MRRRALLATGCAGGLALLGAPVRAQVAEALAATDATVPTGTGDLKLHSVHPHGDGPFPVVLVAGSGAWAADACERLAKAGDLAVAVDLDAGDDAGITRTLDSAAAWAGSNGGDLDRLGIVGYGGGGRAAWLYAASRTPLRAAVAWSGPVHGRPLEVAGDLRAPLLGLYGKNDPAAPRALLLDAERRAQAAGHTIELVAYVGVGADFATGPRNMAAQAATADAWTRTMAWLQRFGIQ